MKKISVIIPTYNEEMYISQCIDSLLLQDYPKDNIEVFIVDGKSSDMTCEIVESYIDKYPYIKLLQNPQKIVPFAMNKGIEQANGEYIIRLDAHASYPSNYFSGLIYNAEKYNTDNIGGVCVTDVKNLTIKSWAIKTVLSHKFGVGNATFRVGASRPQIVDTVPFGCFKRDVFDRFGLYDERLVRNQDIELNKRIERGGGKILLVPEIICTYFARETFSALAKNNYKNGLWNILTVYFTKNFGSLSLRHFIPLIFLLSIILPAILSILIFEFMWLSILSLMTYSIALLFICFSISWHKPKRIIYLFAAFFLLHTSYGLGSIVGIFKAIKLKLSNK